MLCSAPLVRSAIATKIAEFGSIQYQPLSARARVLVQPSRPVAAGRDATLSDACRLGFPALFATSRLVRGSSTQRTRFFCSGGIDRGRNDRAAVLLAVSMRGSMHSLWTRAAHKMRAQLQRRANSAPRMNQTMPGGAAPPRKAAGWTGSLPDPTGGPEGEGAHESLPFC